MCAFQVTGSDLLLTQICCAWVSEVFKISSGFNQDWRITIVCILNRDWNNIASIASIAYVPFLLGVDCFDEGKEKEEEETCWVLQQFTTSSCLGSQFSRSCA